MKGAQQQRKIIPAIERLKGREQWVAWSRSKVPINPHTGGAASSTDPGSWGSLERAKYTRTVQGLPGVGFVFSPDDPFVGVDLDGAVDPITGELRGWAAEIVEELDSYTEYSPSGLGVHVWLVGELPVSGARRDDPDRWGEGKLEVYAHSRYFTVTGRHVAGTPRDMREPGAGELDAWFSRTFPERAESAARANGPREVGAVFGKLEDFHAGDVLDWIGDALAHIPAEDYHDWIRVGMALKRELGDAGFGYWREWSASSPKYPGDGAVARKWRGLPGTDSEVTLGTVVWLAEANGWTKPSARASRADSRFTDGLDAWIEDQTALGDPERVSDGLEIVFHDLADLYEDRSPYEPFLIEPGLLGTGDLMLLFGPPKSMKSMICLDLFRQMALGEDWLELSPARPLTTLYAQFELKADGMRRRAHLADLSREQLDRMRGRFIVTERFTPVLNAEFVASFAERALEQFGPDLDVLVLDPLANIFGGESENDNAEMATFLRKIKYLRNRINPDTSIVIVHHANKRQREDRRSDPFGSIRGASALRGAYDAGVYVDRLDETSGLIEAFFELRNGPGIAPKVLAFERGCFHEVGRGGAEGDGGELAGDQLAERALETTRADLAAEDPIRYALERILMRDARRGQLYQSRTFADAYDGHEILGSAATIRRHLSRLATRGIVAFFESVGDYVLPETHHRSPGYLCVRGLTFQPDEGAPDFFVQPQSYRDPATGKVAPCSSWGEITVRDE